MTVENLLVQNAYVFQNTYWHRKLIPDPQDYLDLQKLLHKRQAPEKDEKLLCQKPFRKGKKLKSI
ncbi:36951_t:CDS:2 [Racocetra persica]|uniref:36951_t:CDS:1 n=1 Tax=Racocetra persica TaxID=160502 RepID=A0ACA9PED1_9GLOM|nr:36951_t:CDS:2 [Racocetra persica]